MQLMALWPSVESISNQNLVFQSQAIYSHPKLGSGDSVMDKEGRGRYNGERLAVGQKASAPPARCVTLRKSSRHNRTSSACLAWTEAFNGKMGEKVLCKSYSALRDQDLPHFPG
jgi:hypothetical protein